MKIRTFKPSDLDHVLHLFYDTVHTINAADYSTEQLHAWAPRHIIAPGDGGLANPDKIQWLEKLIFHHTVIVENEDEIIGFGDLIECTIDHLYVHKNHQRKGVATLILQELGCIDI